MGSLQCVMLFNGRIVVPKSLQQETLSKIHDGHQGIERCLVRAKASVWWPGITKQLTQKVQHCEACCKNASPAKEPLMATPLPEYPWQKVGTDLFELKGTHYSRLLLKIPRGHKAGVYNFKCSHLSSEGSFL